MRSIGINFNHEPSFSIYNIEYIKKFLCRFNRIYLPITCLLLLLKHGSKKNRWKILSDYRFRRLSAETRTEMINSDGNRKSKLHHHEITTIFKPVSNTVTKSTYIDFLEAQTRNSKALDKLRKLQKTTY